MKRILWVLALLLTISVCFGDVNWGIQTRKTYQPVIWPVADTVLNATGTADSLYALDTTGYVIFRLSDLAEQGFNALVAISDSSDSLDMWFSTGCQISYFGVTDTAWSENVKCLWNYRVTAYDAFGPINPPFLQSLALVDSSDYMTGYMPGDYFKVTVWNLGTTRDTVSVESGNGSWNYWAGGAYHDVIVKGWFK